MSVDMEDVPLFLPATEDDEQSQQASSKFGVRASGITTSTSIYMNENDEDVKSGLLGPPTSSPPLEPTPTFDESANGVEQPATKDASFSSIEAQTGLGSDYLRKKRKVSPELHIPPPAPRRSAYFLGSILVSNAWSTVRGTGYVKPGEPITVEREVLESGGKSKGNQATLNSMFKGQAKNALSKKGKTNNIVRLRNSRGFEFARLPSEVSAWVSKLMDFDIISFKGSQVVDCPERLQTGSDMLVSLAIYILPSAFKRFKAKVEPSRNAKGVMWNDEGVETQEEELLRKRKTSLQSLFRRLDLKPRRGENAPQDKENIPPEGSPPLSQIVCNGFRKGLGNVDGHNHSSSCNHGASNDDEDDAEVLSQGDLQVIYKRAQANDATMEEMEPCESFQMKLRPYQKQALFWMYSRETGSAAARQSHCMHPLWSEYVFPPEPDVEGLLDLTADEITFYYNSHSGELSLDFPRADHVCRGGILADEMGMGKTIMVSSLIQTNRGEKPEEEVPDDPLGTQHYHGKPKQLKLDAAFRPTTRTIVRKTRATLIIAPASLLDQWASELKKSSERGTLNVTVWHGTGREDLESMIDSDVDAIDIIITSYGTLASEHAKHEKAEGRSVPLIDIEWYRIVLDEAHNIKTRDSKSAKAAFGLRSPRRWALTGTPIVNRLEDLFSLLKFVNFTPWSDYSFFRSIVTLPFLNHEPKAIEVVQVILESVLLRREKTMRDRDGQMIVQLPDKVVKHEYLDFGVLERKIYNDLYGSAKRKFNKLSAQGMVGKRYTSILAMLMKLRRAVLHPSLVLNEESDEDSPSSTPSASFDVNDLIKEFTKAEEDGGDGNEAYAKNVLQNLKTSGNEECPICMDIMEEPVVLPACYHLCCKDCILALIHDRAEKNEESICPTCRKGPIKAEELLELVKRKKAKPVEVGIKPEEDEDMEVNEPPPSSPAFELRKNDFKSSTKLNALIAHLRRLRDQDPCFRVIVFSQFTSFLDIIEVVLQRENLAFYRLDGATEIRKRHQAIANFNVPSREPKVFMLSLKAGGVGLNLTTANHVFMMDCWWNAAIENQAIDRVPRIGQERTVYVTHFIISDTIEGRVLKIQKRKTAIVKEAFKGQGTKDSETMDNLKLTFDEDF